MASKRSQWCEFDKETRKYIKKRDNNKCIYCDSKGALQIAHIFLNRSHGGKGSKENGVLLCTKCHSILDNPIGIEQSIKSKEISDYCKKYLIEKENITFDKSFINTLKFNKKEFNDKLYLKLNNVAKNISKIGNNNKLRCRDCQYMKKIEQKNGLNTNYCSYLRKIVGKNNPSCENIKNII